MTRCLPWHQHIYDLLDARSSVDADRAAQLDALQLPRAVCDFWATLVTLDLGAKGGLWQLSTDRLFAEYSGGFECPALGQLLGDTVAARAGERPEQDAAWGPPPTDAPLVFVEADEMRIWHAFIALDGSDDPPVVTHCRDSQNERAGWTREERPFSGFMFSFIADYYGEAWTPLRFFGPNAAERGWDDGSDFAYDDMHAVLKPSRPCWLRGRGERVSASAIDAIRTAVAPCEEGTRDGLAEHRFHTDTGRMIVTSDADESAWWIDGTDDTVRRFAELAVRHAPPSLDLIADSERARRVMSALAR